MANDLTVNNGVKIAIGLALTAATFFVIGWAVHKGWKKAS